MIVGDMMDLPMRAASGNVSALIARAGHQCMAGHANTKATGLYDRRVDDISISEVERVGIQSKGDLSPIQFANSLVCSH